MIGNGRNSNGANFLNFQYQPAKVHEDIMVFGKAATSHTKNNNSMVYNPQMEEGSAYISVGHQRKGKVTATVRSNLEYRATPRENRFPRSIQKFGFDKEKFHPTQKPVKLLEYLIKTYSNEGDLILDNCMGSGSTGVACMNTGRNFIGIEKEESYFKIAQERIAEAQSFQLLNG